jgi:NAD(P)H-dependent FMN reductase
MPRIAIIVGSTRQGRFADKPAQWIAQKLAERSDVDVELLDLRDFPLTFFDDPVSPAWRNGAPIADPTLRAWSEAIDRADGFIIVSPEYNHGYTAVLKNAIDHLYTEWNRKPVGFVGYGGVNGSRAIEQLRQVVIELDMAPIKRSVSIPTAQLGRFIMEGANEFDFSEADGAAEAMIDDLLWWVDALASARKRAALVS